MPCSIQTNVLAGEKHYTGRLLQSTKNMRHMKRNAAVLPSTNCVGSACFTTRYIFGVFRSVYERTTEMQTLHLFALAIFVHCYKINWNCINNYDEFVLSVGHVLRRRPGAPHRERRKRSQNHVKAALGDVDVESIR